MHDQTRRKNKEISESGQEQNAHGHTGLLHTSNLEKQNLLEPLCTLSRWEPQAIWWDVVCEGYKSLLCSTQTYTYTVELSY